MDYDLAVNRTGDMKPQMMVLGVVASESGTVANTQRRLIDLFPSAGIPKNAAHTNLPTLEKKGYVCLVERGVEPTQNWYEATEAGTRHLHEWVRSLPPPPAIREAIHGKVEFASLEDLAGLIRIVREEERACQAASDHAHQQMLSAQRVQLRFPPKDLSEDLSAALRMLRLKDITLMWSDVAARRKNLGDEIERIIRRFAGKAR